MRADVRVIAATKRDLKREVERGKFREDLYFRLAVVPITVPALRARREDIRCLVHLMLQQSSRRPHARPALDGRRGHLRADGARLAGQRARAAQRARARGRTWRAPRARPSSADHAARPPPTRHRLPLRAGAELPRDARKYDAEFERRYVKWLLGRHSGNISAAAREAKMDRKHLHDMAKKHGLRGKDDDGTEG